MIGTFFYWVGVAVLAILFIWVLIGFLSGIAISLWHYSRDKNKAELKNRLVMSLVFSMFGLFNVLAVWDVYQDEKDTKP